MMKITFLGGAQTVTGSKYLLEAAGKRILVDCGLFQGLKELRLRNWDKPPFDIHSIDAVVLTHAHIDHSGYLPILYQKGYRGPVYSTQSTFELCRILLPDSGYLHEEEARFANKHGFSKHKPALPLYTEQEARDCLPLFKPQIYNQVFSIGEHLKISFSPAGHILGSACVSIFDGHKTIVFSGDVGRLHDTIMKPPQSLGRADYLLVESTYGNRLHDKTDPKIKLAEIILRTINKKGVLLIPSFAVGRAQTILHLISELRLEKKIPKIPVYLNSPMAIKATDIYCGQNGLDEQHLSKDDCELMFNIVDFVKTAEESKALNEKEGPMILISASGMATGGRILHHLKAFVGDEKNCVLFMGFQAAGTRGEAMLSGVDRIKIHGQYYPVRAEVSCIDTLSAHADYAEMMEWLKKIKQAPQKTFIVHGEPAAQDHLRRHIIDELGWPVEIPHYLDTVELA
ncbi:MAG: hypothetical protein ACD_73C00410G0001 [uncultured bacterium]|nr:MAG: hypothetical protein ACD_73C00410G0001 [uncultured bacterium]